MYEFRRHPWDNTYMMSLMNILIFATRLIKDDKLTDGCEKKFWKSSKQRILVSNDPRWIILVTPVQNVSVHIVPKTEGVRCFTSEGVTAKDPKVRHGMTGWKVY